MLPILRVAGAALATLAFIPLAFSAWMIHALHENQPYFGDPASPAREVLRLVFAAAAACALQRKRKARCKAVPLGQRSDRAMDGEQAHTLPACLPHLDAAGRVVP